MKTRTLIAASSSGQGKLKELLTVGEIWTNNIWSPSWLKIGLVPTRTIYIDDRAHTVILYLMSRFLLFAPHLLNRSERTRPPGSALVLYWISIGKVQSVCVLVGNTTLSAFPPPIDVSLMG